MRITHVNIVPGSANNRGTEREIAEAEVEFDGVMALRGIGIHRGPLGYFLTFPASGRRRLVEGLRPSFARALRTSVLEAFHRQAGLCPAVVRREAAHAGGAA